MVHIEITDLYKSYFLGEEEVPVIKGLSLSIASGQMVSLTGPSGVGKSTLLHLLGTLDVPSSGSIKLDGSDIFQQSAAEICAFRNQNIGFVFQFHHLLPEFTAVENVMMPLLLRRERRSKARTQAQETLAKVGLSHRVTHKPGELSGGEQQRVALARAIVTKPRLLLADEPTGNLDEATGGAIMDLVTSLNREEGLTVLLVTHHPGLAQRAAKRLSLTPEGLIEANA